MHTRWDILGVGSAAVDDLLLVDRFPQPDEKMQVQARQRQGGGQTATALVAAARQGARVAFCGWLGDDELSRYTIQELERERVDCSPVIHAEDRRPFHAVIIVDTSQGSRTILYSAEGAREPADASPAEVDKIDPALVAASRVLFIDQNTPRAALNAARLARAQGIPVIADIEAHDLPHLEELLALIDHLIVSLDCARGLTGRQDAPDMALALAQSGRAASVVTCGSQGCWYALPGSSPVHFPAFPVQVVDTTGCGDVFHGAYAAAIARGESIPRAVALASATAALKATRPGGRAGIPDLPTAERFLIEHLSTKNVKTGLE